MAIRAVIYARYSTDMQRQASIDDQSEVCRRYIERQGWTLVETYADPATSGSSAFRPGFQRMRTDASARRYDIVVTEAIDRLSRNLGDIAKLFDELTFNNVQIHTTAFGLVTQMHVGVMGMMGQMQLADIREKTRRGLAGRVREGKSPGGLAYGYDLVSSRPSPEPRTLASARSTMPRLRSWSGSSAITPPATPHGKSPPP